MLLWGVGGYLGLWMKVSTPDCDGLRAKTKPGNVTGVSTEAAVRTEARAFPNTRVFL